MCPSGHSRHQAWGAHSWFGQTHGLALPLAASCQITHGCGFENTLQISCESDIVIPLIELGLVCFPGL